MAQSPSKYIKGKGFEGYIFNEQLLIFGIYHKERFTPSKKDIVVAEKIVKCNLSKINHPLVNQGDNCPIIHENLKKYIRQYAGYIDNNAEKIIWINFYWCNELDKCNLGEEFKFRSGGCSKYWNIKVNITSKTLFELNINDKSY